MKKLVAFLFASMMIAGVAHAHSGGTDANGCHGGSKPYHCH
ncbi:YHYH domain-containing protein [Guyparkeria sp. SCN-R1]|nr:YHYH domain-containing protein [Guyparkeria sp. SCN-R1]